MCVAALRARRDVTSEIGVSIPVSRTIGSRWVPEMAACVGRPSAIEKKKKHTMIKKRRRERQKRREIEEKEREKH